MPTNLGLGVTFPDNSLEKTKKTSFRTFSYEIIEIVLHKNELEE